MNPKYNTIIKWGAAALLLLNAAGAIPAGILFIIDPSGALMGTSTALLQQAPFSNFLIPGVVLFIANGLCSIAALLLLLKWQRAWAPVFQGIILLGWLAIQVWMLQSIHAQHIVMAVVGVLLVLSGMALGATKR